MTLPLYQVDAFTDAPFAGNPAAVCLCFDALPEDETLQQIAAEMNLAETAFLSAPSETGDGIQLDFPTEPVEACEAPAGLAEALGAAPVFTGRNRMDLLALLDDVETVRALAPDFRRLKAFDARGVIATAEAPPEAGFDFASRFFAPGAGVDEDPVTGSAHCALAPFWGEQLGKEPLTGRQVSKRGGTVRCENRGERVVLGGPAVTVLRGELTLP